MLGALAVLGAGLYLLRHWQAPGLPAWIDAVIGVGLLLVGSRWAASIEAEERREWQESERRHDAKFEGALNEGLDRFGQGLDVALFRCSDKGMVLYANPKARDLFRFTDPQSKALIAITLSYDIDNLFKEAIHSAVAQSAELDFAYPSERSALVRCWPEPGSRSGFVSILETTDLRRLERVRQDFVANVSHELRTPLASIRAMSETLLEETKPDPDLQTRYLRKVVDEVDRLTSMANDLLVLTSAESGPVRKQACDLGATLRTAMHQLEFKAKEKRLSLTYTGPQSLILEANIGQMGQVATNLIENALNYTSEGSVHVELVDKGGTVELAVSDTGMGIPAEETRRIFERFYRVDRGRSRETGGTGLGLSIVKHALARHQASLEIASTPGKGSRFAARFPSSRLLLASDKVTS